MTSLHLFLIANILAGLGKLTYFAWLLYEFIAKPNAITTALMLFFLFLGIEQAIIIYILVAMIGESTISFLPIFLGAINGFLAVSVMITMIIILTRLDEINDSN